MKSSAEYSQNERELTDAELLSVCGGADVNDVSGDGNNTGSTNHHHMMAGNLLLGLLKTVTGLTNTTSSRQISI